MDISFISQGLGIGNNIPAGDAINDALNNPQYDSLRAFSAFVSVKGVENVKDSIHTFCSNGGSVRLFVGVDMHGTSKEALEALIASGIETYVVHSVNNVVYHPKIYLFKGHDHGQIILGSSNLTGSGLYQNIEASFVIKYLTNDPEAQQLENDVLTFINGIASGQLGITQKLDQSLLTILVRNGLVLNQDQQRHVRNEINNQIPPITAEERQQLKNSFNKVKTTRLPKVKGNTIIQENVSVHPGAYSTVIQEAIAIPAGSMWIETGAMTGGSRNILDLSKFGRRDSQITFGSVEYFGIDKDNYSQTLDITLRYDHKDYIGNTIFYNPQNSNWRIRLNGRTANNELLTDVFRAVGSQYRIFLFERTSIPNKYIFHILDSDNLQSLEANSVNYARMGNNRNGREYGIIAPNQ